MPNIDKDCTKVAKKEFNLSDKIIPPTCHKNYENIKIEDVKEFIRLLKEKLKYNIVEKEAFISFSEEAFQRDIEKEIDKLAGDKLK